MARCFALRKYLVYVFCFAWVTSTMSTALAQVHTSERKLKTILSCQGHWQIITWMLIFYLSCNNSYFMTIPIHMNNQKPATCDYMCTFCLQVWCANIYWHDEWGSLPWCGMVCKDDMMSEDHYRDAGWCKEDMMSEDHYRDAGWCKEDMMMPGNKRFKIWCKDDMMSEDHYRDAGWCKDDMMSEDHYRDAGWCAHHQGSVIM